MLEHPPIAGRQEELDAIRAAFTFEVQKVNAKYPLLGQGEISDNRSVQRQ
jgi:hypothetical protein